jgi:hypothetical protein
MPYQKFSALFKSEIRGDAAPKAPKAPKVVLPCANECPTLGGLGALGGGRVQKCEPAPTAWTNAHVVQRRAPGPKPWRGSIQINRQQSAAATLAALHR